MLKSEIIFEQNSNSQDIISLFNDRDSYILSIKFADNFSVENSKTYFDLRNLCYTTALMLNCNAHNLKFVEVNNKFIEATIAKLGQVINFYNRDSNKQTDLLPTFIYKLISFKFISFDFIKKYCVNKNFIKLIELKFNKEDLALINDEVNKNNSNEQIELMCFCLALSLRFKALSPENAVEEKKYILKLFPANDILNVNILNEVMFLSNFIQNVAVQNPGISENNQQRSKRKADEFVDEEVNKVSKKLKSCSLQY